MKEEKIISLPKDFFSQVVGDFITSKEALKDVIPVNWKEVLKNWKEDEKQVFELVKHKKFD